MWKSLLLVLLGFTVSIFAQKPCIRKYYNDTRTESSFNCVCNATYCDEIAPLGTLSANQVAVYTTSSFSGKRLERTTVSFGTSGTPANIQIQANEAIKNQTIFGFGGAFTDMGSYWAQRLSPAARSSLIRQYWSPTDGIGYSVGRVPMAACDYSFSAYSYNEVNNDFNQTYFQLNAEDYKYKIPTIQEAIQVSGGNLKLFSSPWSAPGWMKNTGSMKGGGYLRGDYNGQYFHSYALYFLRFFQSYAQYNITFWGATLENEPGGVSSLDYFESMFFNASYQRDFVKTHWGPVLRGNSLTKNLKLMILDDNRRNLQSWTDVIYSDPDAYSYIDGAAIHWYDDTGTTTATLTEVQEKYPNKFLFYTECSMAPPTYGSWASADFYVNFIMGILNNWSIGFMDWNIHLDPTGGPGSQNPPIWVSNTTDEFEKQPMFYAKGQLSKFIVPGSVILGLNMENSNQDLEGIAALTPNGQKVIVLNNRSKSTNYTVTIYNSQRSAWINAELEARSVSTYIFN